VQAYDRPKVYAADADDGKMIDRVARQDRQRKIAPPLLPRLAPLSNVAVLTRLDGLVSMLAFAAGETFIAGGS
jgi:hypothetical protein